MNLYILFLICETKHTKMPGVGMGVDATWETDIQGGDLSLALSMLVSGESKELSQILRKWVIERVESVIALLRIKGKNVNPVAESSTS